MPSYVFLLDTDGNNIIEEMINAGRECLDLTGQRLTDALETVEKAGWAIIALNEAPPAFQAAVRERIAAANSTKVKVLSLFRQ